jgi:uncharacterized Fe-S cluster-containing radical SAM superfamily protein
MNLSFNPLERAKEVESAVMKDLERKYYRFRYALYYGGIVTADTIGCNFLCAYCWNYFKNLNYVKIGKFYSPEQVVDNMLKIAERKNCFRFRLSGAEPILGKKSFEHLLRILELLSKRVSSLTFILETNGLMLGYYPKWILRFESFKDFLWVRISIKGYDSQSFEQISGANMEFFKYPLNALKELRKCGIHAWPAVMWEVFGEEGIEKLAELLGLSEKEIETEYLELYPFIERNLKEREVKLKN